MIEAKSGLDPPINVISFPVYSVLCPLLSSIREKDWTPQDASLLRKRASISLLRSLSEVIPISEGNVKGVESLRVIVPDDYSQVTTGGS